MFIENDYLKFKMGRESYSYSIERLAESTDIQYPLEEHYLTPLFKKVSNLISHLVISRDIDLDMVKEIEQITKQCHPVSDIDWDMTNTLVHYIKDFRLMFEERMNVINGGIKPHYTYIFNHTDRCIRYIVRVSILPELNKKYEIKTFAATCEQTIK